MDIPQSSTADAFQGMLRFYKIEKERKPHRLTEGMPLTASSLHLLLSLFLLLLAHECPCLS